MHTGDTDHSKNIRRPPACRSCETSRIRKLKAKWYVFRKLKNEIFKKEPGKEPLGGALMGFGFFCFVLFFTSANSALVHSIRLVFRIFY